MLDLNWTSFVSALIYILTALIVSNFAIRPIASILEERKRRKERMIFETEEVKKEVEGLKGEYKNRILKAEEEIKGLMEKKMEEIRIFEKGEMERVRAKAQEKLKEMRERIRTDVEDMRRRREEIASVVAEGIVKKILEKNDG